MSWHDPGPKEYGIAILMFVLAGLFTIYRIVTALLD